MGRLDKNSFPTVTQVLGVYSDYSKINPTVLSYAADRGTRTHKYCAAIAKGVWTGPIDNDCLGYVESFKDWFDAYVNKVLLVEEELVDEDHQFVGHPDLIVDMEAEGIVLIDLKTPLVRQPLWEGQLGAYLSLAKKNGYPVKKAGSLQLSAEGNLPKMTWFEDAGRAFVAFLSALNAYRYFVLA
jgi:hypothetical protein